MHTNPYLKVCFQQTWLKIYIQKNASSFPSKHSSFSHLTIFMWYYHHLRKEGMTPFCHLLATFSQMEILSKSQWYNSSTFPTITPPSHLLQGHIAASKASYFLSVVLVSKPSLYLSGLHDWWSSIRLEMMCVSSRPRSPRSGWASPTFSCSLLPRCREAASLWNHRKERDWAAALLCGGNPSNWAEHSLPKCDVNTK